MFTLKLDDTGDIIFSSGQLQLATGAEAIEQRCRIILGTNKGEWFLNPEIGIDHSKFLGKNISREEMHDEIVSGLFQEPKIRSVESVYFDIDPTRRVITVSFTAISVDDQVIIAEEVKIGG